MKDKIDIYELINEEDFTSDLKLLSSICGVEITRNIIRYLSGINFYIPKITKLDTFVINYLNNNKKKSIKELAQDLKISEQTVRNVKNRIRETRKSVGKA
jgi:Mor family transcriptional regulator